MHRKSLRATNLKHSRELRLQYAKLIEYIPQDAKVKFNIESSSTDGRKFEAVIGLLKKHSGEMAEADKRKSVWKLHQLHSNALSSADQLHEQFRCFEDGRKGTVVGAEAWMSQGANTLIRVEAQRVASANNICFRALLPNPAEQQFRVLLPISEPECVSSKCEWRLDCHCTTLGQLILALGERYAASQIYFFYRTLRIIAVKRRKDHTSDNRARRVGSHASELKPAQIKQSHRTDRTEIVRQYLAITGERIELPEPNTESFRALFDAALRHVYAYVLQDMSPPWLST